MVNCKDYEKHIYLVKMVPKYDSAGGNLEKE